jgi:chromosomal replication initiation ATPase DnaA
MGLSDDDLLALRDKITHAINARGNESLKVPPVIRLIIVKAANDAGVSPLDVLGRRKVKQVAEARKRAMASCYALRHPNGNRRFSYTGLARYFRRDWTTVEHAVRTFTGERVKP